MAFIVIDGDKNYAVLFKQISCQKQARVHKHQPGRMRRGTSHCQIQNPSCLFILNAQLSAQFFWREVKIIIIYETIRTGIVGRINIDALYLARIGFFQMFQCVKIVS